MKQEIIDKLLEGKQIGGPTWKSDNSLYQYMIWFEEQNGVDFDNPKKDYFVELLYSQKNVDIASIKSKLQAIRRYINESCPEHIDEVPDASEIDLSGAARAQLVPSLEELYSRLSLAYSPDDGDSIYPLCSFAWMGLSFKDAIKIKTEDVDLENGVIHCKAPLIFDKMPNQMVDILKRYRAVKSVRRDNRKIEMPDGRPEFIYKTVSAGSKRSGTQINTGLMTAWFSMVENKYNALHIEPILMSYQDITRSAKFYKMRQLELEGVDWSLRSNSTLIKKIFQSNRVETGNVRYNYEMYKKAFGLK